MTKAIVTISQLPDGKINPKTELIEKPAWQLGFDDQSADILLKSKMLEHLSRGYRKTVENFRRGDVTTVSGGQTSFWIVVFQDYEVRLQTAIEIMQIITDGHRNIEKESKPDENGIKETSEEPDIYAE
tara:strand:- start:861 stop:1244 length:384 start_codon:yes stop_codon:yes gene_type:complete